MPSATRAIVLPARRHIMISRNQGMTVEIVERSYPPFVPEGQWPDAVFALFTQPRPNMLGGEHTRQRLLWHDFPATRKGGKCPNHEIRSL
jgi:hypothetical protein